MRGRLRGGPAGAHSSKPLLPLFSQVPRGDQALLQHSAGDREAAAQGRLPRGVTYVCGSALRRARTELGHGWTAEPRPGGRVRPGCAGCDRPVGPVSLAIWDGASRCSVRDSLLILAFSLTFQIQFREKLLWTAITLFIFLVCCQVSICQMHYSILRFLVVYSSDLYAFSDSPVRNYVFRQCGSLLLDPCNSGLKQRNFDGTWYFTNCDIWPHYATAGWSQNHRSW